MTHDFFFDRVLPAVLSALVVLIFALPLSFVVDALFERAAFQDITACESRRMEARRRMLSADVVCVPAYRATKSDTITVEGVK